MANYSITLNLRGTAVKNSKILANNLERADRAAKSLKSTLQGLPKGGRGRGLGSSSGWHATFSTQSGFGSVYNFGGASSYLAAADIIGRALAGFGRAALSFNRIGLLGGATLYSKGAKILTSAQMGEGIRLLQRRQQARLGFGKDYADAQERADLLAASYGLDPSYVIASMNVLSGMRVGGKKITTAHAERLTQVGGLIAQQSGLPFETVMVNIQQMMAQAVPSMRDIRQLLTHAPILGRYALDEMEKKGITGMSAMEYLKADKGAMMTVFERYLAENPAVLSMRARGVVQRSNVGFYATLAENPEWLTLADRYSGLMKTAATAASSLLSAAVGSSALSTSLDVLVEIFNDAPRIIDLFAEKLDGFLTDMGEAFGFPIGGYKEKAQVRTEARGMLRSYVESNIPMFRQHADLLDVPANASDATIASAAYSYLLSKGSLYDYVDVVPINFSDAEFGRLLASGVPYNRARQMLVESARRKAKSAHNFGIDPSVFSFSSVVQSAAIGQINEANVLGGLLLRRPEDVSLNDFGGGNGGDAGTGGRGIGGYGRDRKALVINFNAPIVDWDSNITADDPQDVVDTVSQTIEDAASRAIQIALLGASGKMGTRF